MMSFTRWIFVSAVMGALLIGTSTASAIVLDLDFSGPGLSPDNEVPPAVGSTATGGEVGSGLSYNTNTNILSFDFDFNGLASGLRDAAKGIHFHNAPVGANGGITHFLNTGTDADVSVSTSLIPIGATSGRVTGTALFTEAEETELLAGNIYLNIHSEQFPGGELRGNLVPEPTSLLLLGMGSLIIARRRRSA